MRWFSFINLTVSVLIVVVLFLTFLFVLPTKETWTPPETADTLKSLPKSSFDSACLEGFHTGAFALKWTEPKMQLPNLQNALAFYGRVQRPDIPEEKILVHLSLSGEDEIRAFDINSPVYLNYLATRRVESKPGRIFSQAGEPESGGTYNFADEKSPLWLNLNLTAAGLEVTVNMLDERGELIIAPEQFHKVLLTTREIPRLKQMGWEIDGQRVDSTLLIRQKARWVGRDLFLQKHGGDEYSNYAAKERIDFLDETPYSCFVEEGSFLVWDQGRWCQKKETLGKPLMVTKKIEERLITFELWDPTGKGKTLLTLVRTKDLAGFPNLDEEFKFIGAKTWAKFIVESHNERLILKPRDWLVLTPEGWVSLDSDALIDSYVEQRLQGPLLVLEKLTKQNGRQVLTGHLFNTSRTEIEEVELATASNTSLANIYSMPSQATLKQSNYIDFEDDLE